MNKKIRTIICTAIFAALTFVCAHAATSSAVMEEYYRARYVSIFPNLNGTCAIPDGEGYIDNVSGSICTNTEDYVVKGKNGFDIPFRRMFKSGSTGDDVSSMDHSQKQSVEQYYCYDYICSADNKTISVYFDCEEDMIACDPSFEGSMHGDKSYYRLSALKRKDTGIFYTRTDTTSAPRIISKSSYSEVVLTAVYNGKTFSDIGCYMQIIKPDLYTYDYEYDSGDIYTELIFQDIFGESVTLSVGFETRNDKKQFKYSRGEGVKYSKYTFDVVDRNDWDVTAAHPFGFEYNSVVKSDDGYTYYFMRGGFNRYDICGVSDRYGNTYGINNNGGYTVTTQDGDIYKCDSNGITKTSGGIVTELVKYSTEVVNSEKDVNNVYKIDDEYRFTITKNSGTSATVSDDETNVIKYYIRQKTKYRGILRSLRISAYMLPYKIEFPTGMAANVEYADAVNWTIGFPRDYYDGYYYPVQKYYENNSSNSIKNEIRCSYEYKWNKNPAYDYISKVVKSYYSGEDEVKKDVYNIEYPNRIIDWNTNDSQNYAKESHSYTYAGSDPDAKITSDYIYLRNSDSASHTKNYAYNAQNQLSRETDGDYECSYTYFDGDDETYLPKTTEYKKDADTTVKVENVLTEDKKSIAAQNTYENDVLKRTVNYTYDSFGNVASESVAVGDKTALTQYAYTYSLGGGYTVTKTQKNITDSEGYAVDDIVTTTVYDSEHRPISQTDGNGGVTTMTYDMSGRLLSASYPDGTSESFSYDTVNNIVTCTAKNGTVYKVYFDEWNNRIKTTAVADGTEVVFDEYSYNGRGLVESYKRYTAAGVYNEAKYTYDGFGTIAGEKVYDTDGTLLRNISYTQSISKDSSNCPVTTVKRSTSGGSGTFADYSESADYRGNITKREYSSGSDARTYSYTYDFVGNALTETDPLGNETSTVYDIFGNPTSVTYADGTSVSYEYNSLGLVTQKTDARGNTSRCEYDAAGRLINEYVPLDEEMDMQCSIDYDANGNVISKRKLHMDLAFKKTYISEEYSYDSMNRLAYAVAHPTAREKIYTLYSYNALGTPTTVTTRTQNLENTGSDRITAYTYDGLGRMITETTPDGNTKTYSYDYQGRTTKITDSAGIEDVYTYTAFDNIAMRTRDGESVAFAYDVLGNRTQMTDSSGTTNYEYNPFGELTTETKDDILKSYTYDSLGRRTAFSVTNGANNVISNTYGYDSVGRLTSVVNGQDYVEYTYDGNSNLLTSSVNGVLKSENTYNVGNLPKVIRQYASGELQDTSTYVYNEDGTLYRSVTERATGEEQQLSYNYDYMGRMYSESVFTKDKNTGYVTTWLDYSISYDEYGNIDWEYKVDRMLNTELMVENTFDTANKITQTRVKDLKISDGDQYISDTAYTYNTNGAITAITENGELKKSFEYDGFGRLSRASVNGTESEYTYNGDNLRQTKSVDGALTTHILDGANVVADISDSGTKTFVRGNSLELFKTQGGSTKTYLNSYPRNDVSALVDSDGSTSDYIYTAYGEKIGTNDNTENPFGYCGEYFDTETGLVYLRNRYYDPTMHRFISEDPAKDGLNWYAYAGCNPTKYVDPWGLRVSFNCNTVVTRTNDSGDTYQIDTSEIFLNEIITATGDDGFYYDGKELCYKPNSEISGGSEIFRRIIHYLIDMDYNVTVKLNDFNNIDGSGFTPSIPGRVHVDFVNDTDELTAAIVHELAHAYTEYTGINNRIVMKYSSTDPVINEHLRYYIKHKHQEATAITIEDRFRADMGYLPRNAVTDKLIGVNDYGQFPLQLTTNSNEIMPAGDGLPSLKISDYVLATTLYTYSEGIVDYILNQ